MRDLFNGLFNSRHQGVPGHQAAPRRDWLAPRIITSLPIRLGAGGFRAKRDKTYRDELHGDLTSEIGGWEL